MEWVLNGYSVSFWGGNKNTLELAMWWSYNTVNLLKASELYTLKWLTLGYVHFTSKKKSGIILLENKLIDFPVKGKFIKICFIYWAFLGICFLGILSTKKLS